MTVLSEKIMITPSYSDNQGYPINKMIRDTEFQVLNMAFFTTVLLLFSLCYVVRGQCFYTGSCFTKHDKGVSYRGHENTSHSGRKCVPWSHHLHYVTPDRYPYDNLEGNYCRNPQGSRASPWCYISASGKEEESWEICNILFCDGCLFRGVQMKEGDKFHDGCSLCVCQKYGLKCLNCPESRITNQMGCYIKYNNKEEFPKCCSREVCHGRDADFDMQEYFKYLQAVLQVHQYSQATSVQSKPAHGTTTYRNETHSRNINVLP